MITLYGLLWAAGGNDLIAVLFDLNLNYITYFMRGAILVIPPIVFFLTRRWCISLQRSDNDKLLHGYETGIIMRSAEGGYSERHLPISDARAYTLTARDRDEVYELESTADGNGVRAPGSRAGRIRARLSRGMFENNVQKPTHGGARGGPPPRRARARAPGRPRPPGRRPPVRRPPRRRGRRAPPALSKLTKR